MKDNRKPFFSPRILLVLMIISAGLVLCSAALAERVYAPDGKGYLDYIETDTGHLQPFLHLEGNGYEMGYQQGYLIPEKCAAVASDEFFTDIAVGNLGQLGIDEKYLLEPIVELLLAEFFDLDLSDFQGTSVIDVGLFVFKHVAFLNEPHIPVEYIEEMQGIADGAQDRGVDLHYSDVLLLNVGFDALLSAGYPIATAMEKLGELTSELELSCNAHILDGDATVDDNLYLGRDFMFGGTGFTDHPVIIETYGDNGRNRVVSVSVAGMVGCVSAMNEKGLGIGQDMVPSLDCTPGKFGMGTLLTARWVMEQADDLGEAVSMIADSKRGVSWVYPIADGRGKDRGGVSLEVSAHHYFPRYIDYVRPWWQAWMSPVDQMETYDDALVQTNHYISPGMHMMAPTFLDGGSVDRYEGMIDLLHQDYGTYDEDKALDFINWMYTANGQGPADTVRQSITLYNLTELSLQAYAGPQFGQGVTRYTLQETPPPPADDPLEKIRKALNRIFGRWF